MIAPIIKNRKIIFRKDTLRSDLEEINIHLKDEKGVIQVIIDSEKNKVKIKYDLKQINFETIEQKIIELGFVLSNKWTDKFRRGFVKFKEQNEMDHLTARPSPCCSDSRMR